MVPDVAAAGTNWCAKALRTAKRRVTASVQRPLSGKQAQAATGRCWPVSDLWLHGTDWSAGGSCPMVADRPIAVGGVGPTLEKPMSPTVTAK